MKFTPRPIQEEMWSLIFSRNKMAIWGPMGSGKTSVTISAIEFYQSIIDRPPCLVVAPKYVAMHTWPDEVKKFEDFSHLKVSVICGTAKQRQAAVDAKADIYCINYENLVWLRGVWPKKRKIRQCVIDEATKVKSYRRSAGSSRARALHYLIKKTPIVIELTGTPGGNGVGDLWGQLWFLDHGRRLGDSYSRFQEHYFKKVHTDGDTHHSTWVMESFAEEAIMNKIKDICFAIPESKYFDLEEISEHNVKVTLPKNAMAQYKEMEDNYYVEIEGSEIEASTAAVKSQKCIQLASGAAYTSGDDFTPDGKREWKPVHDVKLDALETILGEANGESVIVAYHFQSDVARIQKRFKNAVLFGSRKNILSDWNAGKVPLLLAHPASIGHGLNMQDGGRIIVFFSHWWSFEEKEQITKRIGPLRQFQSGHPRTVFRYNIVARNTIDERIIMAHKYKFGVNEALFAAASEGGI